MSVREMPRDPYQPPGDRLRDDDGDDPRFNFHFRGAKWGITSIDTYESDGMARLYIEACAPIGWADERECTCPAGQSGTSVHYEACPMATGKR